MKNWAMGAALAAGVAALGCGGGGDKPAESPGACPPGTVLKGSDCLPDDAAGDDSSSPPPAKTGGGGGGGGGGDEPAPAAGGKTAYDKDAVEIELKRAARQVKSSCGSATDEGGKATGPWGATRVSLVIGRNGHIKQVTVPAPYDGKPVGVCIIHAFQKIQFPPYAGSADAQLDWDVETVPPKK